MRKEGREERDLHETPDYLPVGLIHALSTAEVADQRPAAANVEPEKGHLRTDMYGCRNARGMGGGGKRGE